MTRSLHPTEWQNQVAVMTWARLSECRYPELRLLHHIPNGGSRYRIEAARLKQAGVRPGPPDLYLDCARGGYHGLRIELKSHGGKLSPMQVAWHEALADQGYYVHTSWDAEDAIHTIERYLNLSKGN